MKTAGHLICVTNQMNCFHINYKNIESLKFYDNLSKGIHTQHFGLARSYITFI